MHVTGNVLVTGSSGFIGSYLTSELMCRKGVRRVIGMDMAPIPQATTGPHVHIQQRITKGLMLAALHDYEIDTVFHLAAEASVDGSIKSPEYYCDSNCGSVAAVLDAVRSYVQDKKERVRVVNVNTDEVYGPSLAKGADEYAPYAPTNPYSASKAFGALLAQVYHETYGLDVVTTFACNTYGPMQGFDKLIPRAIRLLSEGKKVPIYGDGTQFRNWMYVSDHCRALILAASQGEEGGRYNVGTDSRLTTVEVVALVALAMGLSPDTMDALVEFGVEDRASHDQGYMMHTTAIRRLGWDSKVGPHSGIQQTVNWYLAHKHLWTTFSSY